MATSTTNYGLRKPATTDYVNVQTDLNANYDIIDSTMKDISDDVVQNAEDIATNTEDIATNAGNIAQNAQDIGTINTTLANFAFARMNCAQAVSKGGTGTTITIVFSQSGVTNGTCLVLAGSSLYLVMLGTTPTVTSITGSGTLTATFDSGTLTFTLTHSSAAYLGIIAMGNAGKYGTITVS